MKRFINIDEGVNFERYNTNSWAITIKLSSENVIRFFMELELLSHGLASSLTIKSKKDSEHSIVLELGRKSSAKYKNEKYHIQISTTDLGIIAKFLLEYYRDGYVTYNHIDVELVNVDNIGNDGTLVIGLNEDFDPMPGDEARRILGLEQ